MNNGKYVFSQIMNLVSNTSFETCVNRYRGNLGVRHFTCWKQFLCMAFGQLTHRESLSDTILCLSSNTSKLYHLGIGKIVSISTLSRANESRNFRIYQDLATHLINEAKLLFSGQNHFTEFCNSNVFAIDSTTIDLCITTFYWATFRSTKSGIKLHTQLDLKSNIPEFILITNAEIHDVNILDIIQFEVGSFYIMDKGYIDFVRLYKIHLRGAFFVTRAKINMNFSRIQSNKVDKSTGVKFDQIIKLKNYKSKKDYPEKLRLIKYVDSETNNVYHFLTNNMRISAVEVALLYKNRWQIELFFKWIKQNLKIKTFWGQSENAVKTQLWIAISVFVIIVIAKKKYCLEKSLYEILQILSINVFEKCAVNQLFTNQQIQKSQTPDSKQLTFF